ncbi:MAG: alkaline phosphatase family protein [Pseudomonadota bacterium]
MAILGFSTQIWITLGPLLVINFIFLVSLLAYTFTKNSRRRDIPESATRHKTKLLGAHLKEWWVFSTDPIAHFLVRIGLRPSIITIIGFLFSAVAGFLFAYGLFGYAGWVMIFGATFDIFDGRVARLTNQETRSGAFLDSVMDRFGEGVCFLGLAFYFRSSWILFFVIAGLIGSMLVSYTRARGEAINVVCKGGSMQRPERIVYLGVSSVLNPVASVIVMHWISTPPPILVIGALLIIAVMTNFTAIQRMVFIMNSLDTMDRSERETIPQLLTKLSTKTGRKQILSKARYGYDRSKTHLDHVLFFLMGGTNIDLITELLKKGELPNTQRYVIERGNIYQATSSFPTTTGPAFTPFITGCFPGTCNIPGARWFDREVPSAKILTINRFRDYLGWGAHAMDHDLSGNVKTIYEYSKRAANILGMLNRGCGIIRDPAFFRLHSLYHGKRSIDIRELENAAYEWFLDAVHRRADFIFYSFPSVDLENKTVLSKQASAESLKRFDQTVGKTVKVLMEEGLFEKTAIMVASDHGCGFAEKSLDLTEVIAKHFSTLSFPLKLREWNKVRAIPLLSGSSAAHIYLRNGDDWSHNNPFEQLEKTGIVQALIEKDEIDLLAGRSQESGIIIQSKKGRARILEKADGNITYHIVDQDPFGLDQISDNLNEQSALLSFKNSAYPDGIMQIVQQFRSSRSGDLIVSASKGAVLDGSKKGSPTHGSLNKENILVPFLSSVPLRQTNLRTVDCFSIVLNLLGIKATHRVDGIQLNQFLESKKQEVQHAQ